MMLATPMFEVSSLKQLINPQITQRSVKGGSDFKGDSESPINADSFETLLPSAIANPPPTTNIKPHGIFSCIMFQFSKLSEADFGLLLAASLV